MSNFRIQQRKFGFFLSKSDIFHDVEFPPHAELKKLVNKLQETHNGASLSCIDDLNAAK